MNWRFIDTNFGTAAYNMAVDEALMRCSPLPVLRIYRWEPFTVSIGYAQKMNEEVEPELCREMGYDFVRRPTGGRAVLHAEELTYSVIASQDLELMGNSTLESYKAIAKGLATALRELGADAQLQKSSIKVDTIHANPCFTSAGRYEILVKGKKILGSAQKRSDGKILQHGSLLIGAKHLDIVELMPKLSEEGKRRMRKILLSRTTTLSDELQRELDWQELREKMKLGFEKGLNITLKNDKLTEEENKKIQELIKKYRSKEWNFRR